MALLNTLLSEARPDLPSAPDYSIERALRRSAGRFFRQSGVWRARIDPIRLKTGKQVYSVGAPEIGARIEYFQEVRYDGYAVSVCRERDIPFADSAEGPPRAIAIRSNSDECLVWPTPTTNEDGKLVQALAVIVPGPNTKNIPTALLDEWSDGIVSGAKWEMMSMAAMPWSNQVMAADYERKFWDEVARAKREQTSGGHAPLRVKPVRFV